MNAKKDWHKNYSFLLSETGTVKRMNPAEIHDRAVFGRIVAGNSL